MEAERAAADRGRTGPLALRSPLAYARVMRVFRFERRWASVVSRALIPTGTLPSPADERDLGDAFARQLALAPWWSAIVMRLAVWMAYLAPLWRLRTLASLTPEAQEAQLEKLMASKHYAIRELMTLLKLQACIGALGDERVLRALGAYKLDQQPVVALKAEGSR